MDAHYFLIGTDGRQYGPLSHDEVRVWLADGRASRYSRSRRDTEPQWLPLREMPEFEDVTRPPHLSGPSPAAAPVTEERTQHEPAVSERTSAALDPIACFRRAFSLVIGDYPVLGMSTIAVALLIGLLTQIPRVAVLVGAVLNNLLMCGIFLLFIGALRDDRPTLEQVTTRLVQVAARIILAGLVQSALMAPLVFAFVAASSSRAPAAYALLIAIAVPSTYLLVGYVFMLPLIADRQLTIWSAMETSRRAVHRQWIQMFGLLVASGMVLLVSAILLGIPLLLTMPVCVGALMVAYTDAFRDR